MWDFSEGYEISVSELFTQIISVEKEIDGITILGGEPLDQYNEILKLLKICKESNISTMLFSGYDLPEIKENQKSDIQNYLDILITGRYEENKRTLRHQWIGSKNQEIHFLSGKYSDYKIINGNYQEITIEDDGSLTILGFPEKLLDFSGADRNLNHVEP